MTDMVGGGNPPDLQTAGFDVPTMPGDPSNWIDPDNRFGGLSNIFSVLGTDASDGGAGEMFRAAADHTILAQQGMYAADPLGANSAGHLATAGNIQGAMDQGLLNTLQDGNNDTKVSAEDAYKAKEKAFNMASKLADFGIGKLPGGSYANMMLGLGGDQKELFIGSPPPQDAQIAHVPSPNFDARTAQVIQAVPRELIPHTSATSTTTTGCSTGMATLWTTRLPYRWHTN